MKIKKNGTHTLWYQLVDIFFMNEKKIFFYQFIHVNQPTHQQQWWPTIESNLSTINWPKPLTHTQTQTWRNHHEKIRPPPILNFFYLSLFMVYSFHSFRWWHFFFVISIETESVSFTLSLSLTLVRFPWYIKNVRQIFHRKTNIQNLFFQFLFCEYYEWFVL